MNYHWLGIADCSEIYFCFYKTLHSNESTNNNYIDLPRQINIEVSAKSTMEQTNEKGEPSSIDKTEKSFATRSVEIPPG